MTGTPTTRSPQERAAAQLGTEHGKARVKPYGDLGDFNAIAGEPGAPRLLADIGAPDLYDDNAPALLETYWRAWLWAAEVCSQCGTAEDVPVDVDGEPWCRECVVKFEENAAAADAASLDRIAAELTGYLADTGDSTERLGDIARIIRHTGRTVSDGEEG